MQHLRPLLHEVGEEARSLPPTAIAEDLRQELVRADAVGAHTFKRHDVARYKLEVFFAEEPRRDRPVAGILTYWENGGPSYDLEGDEKLYLCPGRSLLGDDYGCDSLLPKGGYMGGFYHCVGCGRQWKEENVVGEHVAKMVLTSWARFITERMKCVGYDADVVMNRPKRSYMAAARADAETKYGQAQAKALEQRTQVMYNRNRLITDTSAGADFETRILAFLKA